MTGATVLFAVVASAVAIPAALRNRWKSRVREQFKQYLRENHPDMPFRMLGEERVELTMPDSEEPVSLSMAQVYLAVLSQREVTGGPPAECRAAAFAKVIAAVKDGKELAATNGADLAARVLPRLVNAEQLKSFSPDMPRQALGNTGLTIAYVVDSPNAVAYLHGDLKKTLGLEQPALHARAIENLRLKTPEAMIRKVFETKGICVIKAGDSFEAARLLVVSDHLREGEQLAAFVPDRDTLMLMPVPQEIPSQSLVPGMQWTLFPHPLRITPAGVELLRPS